METTQAVTDAATIPKKPSVNKGGRPSKAALEARARANRDPLASIEGDTSLDQPPDYKPDVTSRIPKPPFFRFGTDQPSPHKPEHFFAWWCGLSAGAKNGSIAYVYRNYPVIQIKTPDSKSPTGFRPSTQIDKRSGSDPLSSLDDVLHHYGSGDYTIRLNQASPNKTVCLCVIKGLRDEQHPAVVDLSTLAIEDPVNKPYIEGLRMRGIRIPGVDPMEDTMDSAAVDRLASTVERMADQNARLANRPPVEVRREEPKPQTDGIISKAFEASMDMMKSVSSVQSSMLNDAVKKVQEVNATATDPLAMLEKLGGVLRFLVPTPVAATGPSQSDAMLTAAMNRSDKLETRIFEMQASQLTLLQTLLAKAQEAPAATAAAAAQAKAPAAAGAPTTPLEMLRELVKLKDGLGSLTGETERGENPAAASGPWWAAALNNLPSLAQMVMGIMAMYSTASYNNAIARVGAGQPTAPPMLPTIPAASAPEPVPGDEIPSPPPGSGTPLPTPGDSTMSAYHSFLAQLERPLRLSLENNETGDEFAEKLVEFHGQMAYDLLHNLGKDQLVQILATYPPIWQVVTAIPQKFQQFLDEFLAYGNAPEPPPPAQPRASHAPNQPLESKAQAAEPSSADVTERMDRLHTVRAGAAGGKPAAGKPAKAPPGPEAQ